jgi:hypothetical protein
MEPGGDSMRVSGLHCGNGRILIQALSGWILAALIVAVALFGPPLTGQSVPTLTELRHDLLMIDREFERWSLRTHTYSAGTGTFVLDLDNARRAGSARLKTQFRGDLS